MKILKIKKILSNASCFLQVRTKTSINQTKLKGESDPMSKILIQLSSAYETMHKCGTT